MIFLELFLSFFKVGLFCFGGGYGMLPLMEETVVAKGWLTAEQFYDFVGVCESTPGPIAVNMATFVGSSQGGILGSAVATLGVVLPSFIIILIIRPFFSYSLIRVFLYMMVPYLTASWSGSVYERIHRSDHGLGSILICVLSSAFFAAAPAFFSQLYEERMTVIWAAAFILTACSLAGNLREWARHMEEPVWN